LQDLSVSKLVKSSQVEMNLVVNRQNSGGQKIVFAGIKRSKP